MSSRRSFQVALHNSAIFVCGLPMLFSEDGKQGIRKRKSFSCVLGSFGCCNKSPQTWWLKTTEIYCLTVFEARSLKSVSLGWNQSVSRVVLSPKAPGENPLPLPASGGCWHSWACGHITLISTPAFSSFSLLHLLLCVSDLPLPPSYKDTSLHFGPTWII